MCPPPPTWPLHWPLSPQNHQTVPAVCPPPTPFHSSAALLQLNLRSHWVLWLCDHSGPFWSLCWPLSPQPQNYTRCIPAPYPNPSQCTAPIKPRSHRVLWLSDHSTPHVAPSDPSLAPLPISPPHALFSRNKPRQGAAIVWSNGSMAWRP